MLGFAKTFTDWSISLVPFELTSIRSDEKLHNFFDHGTDHLTDTANENSTWN